MSEGFMPLTRFVLPALVLSAVGLAHPAHGIVAGVPDGTTPDSPANRIDPNTDASPFAGVVSYTTGSAICTGTLISPFHVLTAAHCVTNDSTGVLNTSPGSVTVNFNGDTQVTRGATAITVNPSYSGFNNSIHDDLAIITLDAAAPAFADVYPLYDQNVVFGDELTFVGYGRSGNGNLGYTTDASASVKRTGGNEVNGFEADDDVPGGLGVDELYLFDFDGPSGDGLGGGPTLGNDFETTFGGGDSGGPAFIDDGTTLSLAAVNSFVFSLPDAEVPGDQTAAPLFGSGGGGVLIAPYLGFINGVIPEPASFVLLSVLALGLTPRRRPRRA
ncbi:MAG: trypsin-like serine protease [Planctomycetota bacterium]